jgi:hypothetical protein
MTWPAMAIAMMAATPAMADTITVDYMFSGSVANGPSVVTGALFNPALGTLTGVSADISGQFQANVYIPNPEPSQLTANLDGTLNAPNQSISGQLGTFTLTQNGANYTGTENFDVSVNLTSIGSYIAGSPNATNYLAEIGLYDEILAGGLGASSDLSTYEICFDLTYTYTVPEPSSLLVMGVGAGLLLLGVAFGFRPARGWA